MFALYFIDIR